MHSNTARVSAFSFIVPILAILSSCSHPTPEPLQAPPQTTTAQFSQTGTLSPDQKWWTEFGDSQLNSLIQQAFDDNLSLAQAWGRLEQSQAALKSTGASRYPNLNFSATARRQWQNVNGASNATDTTNGSTGFSSNYEIDLWGKVGQQYAAVVFDYQASEQDLQTAAISLASQVATTWFSLVEANSQQELLQAQLKTAEQTLESIRVRFNNGNRNGTDLLQQEQTVESRRAALILNQADIQVLQNALSILIGQDPSKTTVPQSTSFPELPAFPNTGIPIEVLGNRPDILSSWLAIQSADADLYVAMANRLPSVSLTGSVSAAFASPVNLFENWIKSLTANLTLPILDAGSRKAEVERRKAMRANALLQFQNDYLVAIQEVEDAIIREKQQLAYLGSLDKQLVFAENVFEQTLTRYQRGNQTYIQVLTAQNSLYNLRRTKLSAQRALLSYRISLYRAIGGGLELTTSEAWNQAQNDSN